MTLRLVGEVAERLKAHAWKACVGLPLPRVRIPPSPPHFGLVVKLVDTLDLGSSIRKNVGVQLPPSPPITLGEMAEWSKAAVLKADDPSGSGGSNPSLAANLVQWRKLWLAAIQPTRSRFFGAHPMMLCPLSRRKSPSLQHCDSAWPAIVRRSKH